MTATRALASPADYTLTPTALVVEDEAMGRDRWAAVLREVGPTAARSWYAGDLLAFGERQYGDGTYEAAADALGYGVGSLRNLASVSRRVPPEVRRPDLPWRAHRVVAKLDPTEQRDWLARAAENDWTTDELAEGIGGEQFPTGENDDLDPDEHWRAGGMPDYTPPEEPYRVVVSFDAEEDRDEFLAGIGTPTVHNRSGRTLSVWWPDRPKDDVRAVEFVA